MNASASFRFLGISEQLSKDLKLVAPEADFGVHYQSGKQVGCIELINQSSVKAIEEFYNKHCFKPTDCDIFISIASGKRDEVWRAPKLVNHVIHSINCPIVFSYTC